MDAKAQAILAELKPLIQRARDTDCVLYCGGLVDHWMTPDQMEAANAEGRFIWGAQNWRLIPRHEMLKRYEDKANAAANTLTAVRKSLLVG